MKKITLLFSLLTLMIIGLQAQAADDQFDPAARKFAVTGAAFGDWNMPPTAAQTFTNKGDGTYTLKYEGAKAAGFKLSGVASDVEFADWDSFNAGVMGANPLAEGDNTLSNLFGSGNMAFPVSGNVTLTISEVTESSCKLNITVDQEIVTDKEWYIAGSFTGWANGKQKLNNNGDGTYSITVNGIETGAEFKFINENDAWFGGSGSEADINPDHCTDIALVDGNNFKISSGGGDLTFTIDAENKLSVTGWDNTPEPVEKTYTVAGTKELLGTEADWDITVEAGNDMAKQDDGTYKLVKENVELLIKDYEYKVVVNHSWDESYPDQNAKVIIDKAGKYNVTFTFNAETHEVNAVPELVEATEITSYTIVGDEALMGADWDVNAEANDMTKQEDGTYTLVKNELELTDDAPYKYKVVGNHNYAVFEFPQGMNNQTLAIETAGKYNVTFTFNPETTELKATAEKIEEPQPETKYILHYGINSQDAVWQDVEFVKGEDGKFTAANVEFAKKTEFGIKYGETWYAGIPNEGDSYYWIHAGWCTDVPVNTGDGVKNFRINEAGTYTFVLTVTDEGITMDVAGFPAAPVLGDLDGDGKADVTDVNIMVNMILGKQEKTAAADLDNSGDVDVTDVNILVNIILGKGNTTVEE